MEYNQILVKYLGEMGRYQIGVLCLLLIVRFPSVIHNIGYVFFAATPPHWCAIDRRTDLINLTETDWKTFSLPSHIRDGQRVFSECEIYNWVTWSNLTADTIEDLIRSIRNGTTYDDQFMSGCTQWEYDTQMHVKDSLVTQFNMVCGRAWMKSMVATAYVIGWIVGSPVTAYFSDKYGRRKMILALAIGTVALGLALPFINNYTAFLVVRAFVSATMNGVLAISFTACMELVGPRYRTLTNIVYGLVWTIGYMLLSLVASALRTRLSFMIAAAAPTVILLPAAWFLPESVPWLVAKRRQEDASHLVVLMAKVNKKELPDDLSISVEQEKEKAKTRFLDLLRTPNIRKITVVLFLDWFIIAMLFYAISWTATDVSDDLYMNVFLSGLIELPACVLTYPTMEYLGRRMTLFVTVLLGGLAMLCSLAVPVKGTGMVVLTLVAKLFICIAFTVVFQYNSELYPTVIRTIGFSLSNIAARIGTMLAPFLPLLGVRMPALICGTIAVSASFPNLVLPETLNQKLPSNVQEAEEFGTQFKWSEVFKLPSRKK